MEFAGERREAQLRGRQGRLAFAYLVLHRDRPVRRDELIEALWAHEGAPPSDTALAPVLSRLRRAVEPAVLEGRDTLRLVFPEPRVGRRRGDPGYLAAARAGFDAGAAQAPPRSPSPACCPHLDAPWLTRLRDDLEELRIEALEPVARAGLRDRQALPSARAGRPRRGRRARRSASPLRAALIAVLMRRGNLAEAMRAYDEIRVLLREELGTAPGPELVALLRAAARAARRVRRPPTRVRGLLERDAELAAIAAALARLRAGEGGVLAFEGPAGIGKTRLLGVLRERAVEAGRRGARRARRRARARVRLRRRAPALRGRRCRAEPPPAAARAVFGEGRHRRRPVRGAQRAVRATPRRSPRGARWCSASTTCSGATRLAALRRLPRAARGRPARARRDHDPHRRARRRRAAAGRDRAGPGDRRRPAAAADRGRHGRARRDAARRRRRARSPPPARRSPPATRCCCASC